LQHIAFHFKSLVSFILSEIYPKLVVFASLIFAYNGIKICSEGLRLIKIKNY